MKNDKEGCVRAKGGNFVQLLLDTYPTFLIQPFLSDIDAAISKGKKDIFSDAAYASNLCAKSITKHTMGNGVVANTSAPKKKSPQKSLPPVGKSASPKMERSIKSSSGELVTFCEECGEKFRASDIRFCEECGTKRATLTVI